MGKNIGEVIDDVGIDNISNLGSDDRSVFYTFDSYSRRLNFVNAETQSLTFSDEVDASASNSLEKWVSGKQGLFFFGIEDDKLYLYRQGEPKELVNTFAGEIISYAASQEDGFYIFVDEFSAIMLIAINAAGEIVSSWTGGSIIDGEATITAGDVLGGGHFIVATSSQKIISIDIAASIQSQSWVKTEYQVATAQGIWIGKSAAQPSQALIFTEDKKLLLFDAVSGLFLQVVDLSATNVSLTKSGEDHVIAYNQGTTENRVYMGGANQIDSYLLPEAQFPISETKVIDGYLLAVGSNEINQYYKVRLSDGLIERRVDVDQYTRLGFTKDYIVVFEDSPLGFIKVINFDTREETVYSGFNLEHLQK